MSDMPYGCKGCRCWTDETPAYGLDRETWYPNAACPHHGLLADFTERKDTGVYRVVPAEPQGCSCSVNNPRDICGYCAKAMSEVMRDPDVPTRRLPPRDLSTPLDGPECPPGVHSMFDFCPGGCTTTEEERGVLATVRRWISRALWTGQR